MMCHHYWGTHTNRRARKSISRSVKCVANAFPKWTDIVNCNRRRSDYRRRPLTVECLNFNLIESTGCVLVAVVVSSQPIPWLNWRRKMYLCFGATVNFPLPMSRVRNHKIIVNRFMGVSPTKCDRVTNRDATVKIVSNALWHEKECIVWLKPLTETNKIQNIKFISAANEDDDDEDGRRKIECDVVTHICTTFIERVRLHWHRANINGKYRRLFTGALFVPTPIDPSFSIAQCTMTCDWDVVPSVVFTFSQCFDVEFCCHCVMIRNEPIPMFRWSLFALKLSQLDGRISVPASCLCVAESIDRFVWRLCFVSWCDVMRVRILRFVYFISHFNTIFVLFLRSRSQSVQVSPFFLWFQQHIPIGPYLKSNKCCDCAVCIWCAWCTLYSQRCNSLHTAHLWYHSFQMFACLNHFNHKRSTAHTDREGKRTQWYTEHVRVRSHRLSLSLYGFCIYNEQFSERKVKDASIVRDDTGANRKSAEQRKKGRGREWESEREKYEKQT